jgi:hypothetical protein
MSEITVHNQVDAQGLIGVLTRAGYCIQYKFKKRKGWASDEIHTIYFWRDPENEDS